MQHNICESEAHTCFTFNFFYYSVLCTSPALWTPIHFVGVINNIWCPYCVDITSQNNKLSFCSSVSRYPLCCCALVIFQLLKSNFSISVWFSRLFLKIKKYHFHVDKIELNCQFLCEKKGPYLIKQLAKLIKDLFIIKSLINKTV